MIYGGVEGKTVVAVVSLKTRLLAAAGELIRLTRVGYIITQDAASPSFSSCSHKPVIDKQRSVCP